MSLPVSQYEALLAEVRCLRRKAQRVQQLATPLISNCSSSVDSSLPLHLLQNDEVKAISLCKMEPLLTERQHNASSNNYDGAGTSSAEGDTTCSEDECGGARSTHMSVSSEPIVHRDRGVSMLYHGTWPVEKTMWNSEPTPHHNHGDCTSTPLHHVHMQDVTSVMSFASSSGGVPLDRVLGSPPSLSRRSSQQLEAKVDMVYSLLAMLSGQEHADMGETLLALSTNPESCLAMRQSGCIPLLVQMVQSDRDADARKKAAQALHNLVHSQPDEKLRKREIRIFKLLEHTRAYTDALRNNKECELEVTSSSSDDDDRHPVQTVAHLMKLSFDELHRQAICTLGGIHIIANLVEAEHVIHGSTVDEAHCILMRRYACMALTNLTFGDSGNKALLCSFREFMRALVIQLQSPSDELRQVTASVLRNLSWRADSSSKEILREVGSVSGLMKAAMLDNKENTLKSILSALWNLSAHCTENKSEICSVEGALGFLVDMLTYKTPSKSLAIIENSGGILRNISSQIAVRDDYREILRRHNCLEILLDQLKSPSLTIVSNACGTLWNLSAKCTTDQEALWQMGAPAMLRSLNHSKHKMIAMGSSAALKNLLSARPSQSFLPALDSTALAMDLPVLPTLGARKQKALLQDLDQTLSETYENIEKDSPVKLAKDDKMKNKCSKQSNDNNPYDSDFTSLNITEPSTSFDSRLNLSLPHIEGVKHNTTTGIPTGVNRSFVKNRPKSVAKNASFGSDSDNRSVLFTDSGLQSLESPRLDEEESHRSVDSIDNDRCKRRELKLKEVSAYSDEKDHCSIEDVSDSDNQSSLGFEQHKFGNEDSSFLSGAMVARKDMTLSSTLSTPSLPHPNLKYASLASSNVTMFDGDIDEIDMEDISIHFASESQRKDCEDDTEKQDVEKEKTCHLQEVVEENLSDFIGLGTDSWKQPDVSDEKKSSSATRTPTKIPGRGIPLPRSLPRPIPSSSSPQRNDTIDGIEIPSSDIATSSETSSAKKTPRSNIARLTSGLPRRSLQHSTPIKINGSSANARSSEASKVQNIDTSSSENEIPLQSRRDAMEDIPRLPSEIECTPSTSSSFSVSGIEQGDLNISQENNDTEETSPRCFTNYEPMNFSLKDERERLLERSCEESNPVDNRMLDPDAMIESLERFTAELVSQASHLQQSKEEDKFKDNTWNEDTSPNEVTFPSISGSAPNVITFDDSSTAPDSNELAKEAEPEQKSNDFSSINTSTMTESTLIAIEATKMAKIFKDEAEMTNSITSVASLELDKIQPPSLVDSLTNSGGSLDAARSPKTTPRKRSIPRGLMVRRALTNSVANGSSLESLENHSYSNLDQQNPPSAMAEVFDMEGSITSVASLPSDNPAKTDFVINGAVNKNSFAAPSKFLNSHLNSFSDLEHINPPSIFNEITDLCSSLADVPTEAIGSETEIFEDCVTHVPPTEDDVTEFSDANSATPIQSDLNSSSPEVSPKKKNLGKAMMTKQRRNLARDRYKTYTVAAEMVMREEEDKQSTSEDFKTVNCASEDYRSVIEETSSIEASPTYSVKASRLTPREKRQLDRSRFETRVVEEAITDILQQPIIASPSTSPARTKLSIRRNFMQKRLENQDRFKTQTLSPGDMDLQKEANLVLKSLRESKTSSATDDLLDCETLSLVSNDDDSEQNSGSPINYRTYHKSWGLKKNIPVIEPLPADRLTSEEEEEKPVVQKPKIVKPTTVEEEIVEEEPQNKAIRGRRKPLYSRTTKIAPKSLKPIKTMTSNIVKNVTSSIKSVKQTNKNVVTKPPVPQSRVSSGYGTKTNSPKTSPARSKLERQGTFTKDEAVKSRIPTPGSAGIRATKPSKIPAKNVGKPAIPRSVNSASSDRVNRNIRPSYGRSTSADSREAASAATNRKIQNSASSQSLKNEKPSTTKKSGIPHATTTTTAQKTGSNTSLNSNGTSAKKQVTSKIASLWKKIEESKNKQPAKKDTRVWIQSETTETGLVRSNTFDNKNGVTLRNRAQSEDAPEKRVSRLGSFIVMDDSEDGARMQQMINAAANV